MGTNYGQPTDGVIDSLPASFTRKDLLKLAFAILDQADITPRLLSLALVQAMDRRQFGGHQGWYAVVYQLGESP